MAPTDIREKLAFYREVTLARNLFTPPIGFSSGFPRVSAHLVRRTWEEYLEVDSSPKVSLYVHIPFCAKKKCSFCMYHSVVADGTADIDAYLDYLAHKAAFFAPTLRGISMEALYIGGGTPSLLSFQQLERLHDEVLDLFCFRPDAERTIEQSFATTSRDQIRLLRERGITRLSFGLQSVEAPVLAAVGRVPAPEITVRTLVSYARELGFHEANIDLMIGLPEETTSGIRKGLRLAVESGAHAVTVYVFRHGAPVPRASLTHYNLEHIPTMLEALREEAAILGFVDTVQSDLTEYQFFTSPAHYTNYSPPCYRTRSETLVGNSTLGLGYTAFSFLRDFFRAVCGDSTTSFDPDTNSWAIEMIDADSRRRVFVLESLDRRGYVDGAAFHAQFSMDLRDAFPDELRELESLGKASLRDGRLVLLNSDRLEFATLCKFFWDQTQLRTLAMGAP